VRRSHADGRFADGGDTNTRYLLDASGRRIEADRVDARCLADAAAFKSSFGPFLHGKDGDRLRQRAGEIRKELSADLRTAVDRLDAEEVEVRERASALLLKQAVGLMPFLVEMSLNGAPVERRGRAADLIEAYFQSVSPKVAGPRLPYGCKIPVMVNAGCGMMREKEEGEKELLAVPCGMAIAPKESRRFLSFLKEQA
jgi:hypothetical protein